ncbi:MAG: methyl-accepting chemotaxis protein [Elstera sp.]
MTLRSRVILFVTVITLTLALGMSATQLWRQQISEDRFAAATIRGQDVLWRKIVETIHLNLEAHARQIEATPGLLPALVGQTPAVLRQVVDSGDTLKGADYVEITSPKGELLFTTQTAMNPAPLLDQAALQTAVAQTTPVRRLQQDVSRKFIIASAFALRQNNQVIGVLTVGRDSRAALVEMKASLGGDVALLNLRGRAVDATDAPLWQSLNTLPRLREASLGEAVSGAKTYQITAMPLRDDVGRPLASLVGFADISAAVAQRDTVDLVAGGGTLGFLLLTVLVLSFYLARSFSPLRQAIQALDALSRGDTNIDLEARTARDEIGAMAGAVDRFRDTTIVAQRLAEERDLATRRRERRHERTETGIRKFNKRFFASISELTDAAEQMTSSATKLSTLSNNASEQSVQVAGAAHQATANVGVVAQSADDLFRSIREIADKVSRSTEIAQRAVQEAQETTVKVQGLSVSAGRITEVVDMINGIARQTRMLALNARVEAERAGVAGRSFAVVAREVKVLADETAGMTEKIAEHIGSIQSATGETTGAITRISGTIEALNAIADDIATAIQRQGETTGEIAHSATEASEGVGEVSEKIVQVSAASMETDMEAMSLNDVASSVKQQIETMSHETQKFFKTLRLA